MSLTIIILAAGQGKRMQSRLPKMLHRLAGKPLLEHVVNTAQTLKPNNILVVYGHSGEQLREQLSHLKVQWVEQKQQLGTGHAAAQAVPHIDNKSQVLILVGDAPLITTATLQNLIKQTPANAIGIITAKISDPSGLGRIVRDATEKMIAVVEDKDATAIQKQIQEINSGIIIAPANKLKAWLPTLKNNNQQSEYYLPEIIPMAISEGMDIITVNAMSPEEVQGINDRMQLAQLERYHQRELAKKLMQNGVTLFDPERLDIRGELNCAADVTIDINVVIEGKVNIGAGCYVGPNTILRDVTIGENVTIKSHSVIEETTIASNCIIGPFARIRPGTQLATEVHVGNFVEIKNSTVAKGSKINHLSYVGDSVVGQRVNIGAGTITCNYDGANKYKTIIEDDVFIGSNTALVAPIIVGKGATIGAGSTLNNNVPADTLTLNRAEARSISGWKRPQKKTKN